MHRGHAYLQQLLAHAVDCHVEDRHDVGAGVGRAVVGDVAGKLLDGHHLGVLCRGEVVGDDGPDECLVLGVGLLALGLGLVDTRLGLVDLEEIRVDGSCRDGKRVRDASIYASKKYRSSFYS